MVFFQPWDLNIFSCEWRHQRESWYELCIMFRFVSRQVPNRTISGGKNQQKSHVKESVFNETVLKLRVVSIENTLLRIRFCADFIRIVGHNKGIKSRLDQLKSVK